MLKELKPQECSLLLRPTGSVRYAHEHLYFWAVPFGVNCEPTHCRPCSHRNNSIERWKVPITQISGVTRRNNFSSPGVWLLSVTVLVYSRRDVAEGSKKLHFVLLIKKQIGIRTRTKGLWITKTFILRVWSFLVTFGPQYFCSALKDVADVDTDMRRLTTGVRSEKCVVVRTS
jgi:hypothetical protein